MSVYSLQPDIMLTVRLIWDYLTVRPNQLFRLAVFFSIQDLYISTFSVQSRPPDVLPVFIRIEALVRISL